MFLAHANNPGFDPTVAELRRSLSGAKEEALAQVRTVPQHSLKTVMPGLYERIVVTTIQIAAHVGLGVGLALDALDEVGSKTSLSLFSREIREMMIETGVSLKRRHSNRIRQARRGDRGPAAGVAPQPRVPVVARVSARRCPLLGAEPARAARGL